MREFIVSESRLIEAPAERVYGILADYKVGHPQILPRPPFESLEVEQGGYGAGTIFRCTMRFWGMASQFRAAVTEPEPGRVMVETDLTGAIVTTFTVEPRDKNRRSLVTFSTRLKTRGGPLGIVQRALSRRMLQPTYVRELANLAAAAGEVL